MKKYIKYFAFFLILIVIISKIDVVRAFFIPSEAYAVGDLSVDWGIGSGNVGPVFSVANMKPGDSVQRTVTIHNGGTVSRGLAIKGLKTAGTLLSSAIMFSIKDGATSLYSKTLDGLFTDSTNPEGVFLVDIPAGATKQLTMQSQMQPSAGNEFENSSVTFNVIFGIAVSIPTACNAVDLTGKFPIYGTAKSDVINGTQGNDVIFGLGGNDTIFGKGGNDCIIGGNGNDALYGESGNDVIVGEDGSDTVHGGVGNDTLIGNNGNDTLLGEEGNDVLQGGNGTDTELGGVS